MTSPAQGINIPNVERTEGSHELLHDSGNHDHNHTLSNTSQSYSTGEAERHDASPRYALPSSSYVSSSPSPTKEIPPKMNSSWQWFMTVAFTPVLVVSLWWISTSNKKVFAFHFVRTSITTIHNRHIALIIAHPDDEAMFFAPTILALSKPELGNTIRVVCLSSGDADGLGNIRKNELTKSCHMLGIPDLPHSVQCIEHPQLPDSMSINWHASTISSVLSKTLSTTPETDTLITFDKSGVSSHPNHISLLDGTKEYIRSIPHPHPLLLYTLSTVSLPRKYASVFDAMTTLLVRWPVRDKGFGGEGAPRELLHFSGWREYRTAQRAMVYGHESQMRWFRWGWIVLSRYMVMNDLKLVESEKI